jgi:uncharacterized Fe-S radical SAM superfamily protein PflX
MRYEWFHNIEGHKTKLNWFLLETALEHYDRIMESDALSKYRKLYTDEQIALFCVYYARRMKESLLNNLRGRRKHILLYTEYIDDYYPNLDRETKDSLSDLASEAWGYKLDSCKNCPTQCLADYKSTAIDFDIYQD